MNVAGAKAGVTHNYGLLHSLSHIAVSLILYSV